jgi:hypothetical protein
MRRPLARDYTLVARRHSISDSLQCTRITGNRQIGGRALGAVVIFHQLDSNLGGEW